MNDNVVTGDFKDVPVYWLLLFFDWDDEMYIIGIYDDAEKATAETSEEELEDGYFVVCPLIMNAAMLTENDLLKDLPDRMEYIAKYDGPPEKKPKTTKVDRGHLVVVK